MRWGIVASIGLGVVAVGMATVSGMLYFERPTVLRVAVAKGDAQDLDLVTAAGKLLKHGHHSFRLKPIESANPEDLAAALDSGGADLSVVRADEAMPAKGDTVVVLHRSVALLLAPNGSPIEKVGDLADKRIGMLSQSAADGRMLDAALTQYDVPPESVHRVALSPGGVAGAVETKSVDAIFLVGLVSDGTVPATVRAVAKAGGGPPTFLPVAEAAAIAQRTPAYESIEVVRGAFGGTPPRPADEFDTLGVTTRLMASADLDADTVSSLTEFLLSQRVALAQAAPIAQRIEAPPTDKGAALPVHPGTAAYIDDDEQTFLDRYSDFIYIGAMVLGVVASGLTAILGRLGGRGSVRVEDLVTKLVDLFKQSRAAPSLAALDLVEDEVDAIVASALDESCLRTLDERKVAALNMAVEQVRSAIRDRRHRLRRTYNLPANDETVPAATGLRALQSPGEDRSVSEA